MGGGKRRQVVIADLQVEAGEKLAKELQWRYQKTTMCDLREADGKGPRWRGAALKEFGGLQGAAYLRRQSRGQAERTLGKRRRTTSQDCSKK